jgi:hypothetical protein
MARGETIRTQYLVKLFLQFSLLFSLSLFTGFTSQAAQSSQQSVKTELFVKVTTNKKRTVIFQKKTVAPKYFVEPDFVRILLLEERLFQTRVKENLHEVIEFKRPSPLIRIRPIAPDADEPAFLKG